MDLRNYLVTGATGFLGRQVVRSLRDRGGHVTALSRTQVPALETVVADLCQPGLCFGKRHFDVVCHIGGLAHVTPKSTAERNRFYEVNVDGTRNLLRTLERLADPPRSFVLFSTVAVYGMTEGNLLAENAERRASDPYGASKRQSEDLVTEWCALRNVRATIVRLPLVVGHNAPGNWGRMVRGLTKGHYFGVGDGSARRSMVLIQDIGDIVPSLSESEGVFHLTDGHHPSFQELERAISLALKRRPPRRIPLRLAQCGAWVGDQIERCTFLRIPFTSDTLRKMNSTLTFSDQKARNELGWRPSRVLDRIGDVIA